MKILRRTLFVLVVVPVLWVVVSLIGNRFDETLDPTLQSLIEQSKRIRPTDGGEIRLGLLWDIPNWREAAHDALMERRPVSGIQNKRFKLESLYMCQETDYLCSKEEWEKNKEILEKGLSSSAEVRRRYELLFDTTDFDEPFEFSFDTLPAVAAQYQVSRLFHLSLNQLPPEKSVLLLVKEAKWLRKVLENRSTVLSKLMDLSHLNENIHMLSRLLQQNPKLLKTLPADYLVAYQNIIPQQLHRLALEGDILMATTAVDNVRESAMGVNLLSMDGGAGILEESTGKFLKLFLQPNATKNLFFRHYMKMDSTKCWQEATEEACKQLNDTMNPSHFKPFYSLTNQVGYSMLTILLPKMNYLPMKTKKFVDDINGTIAKIKGPGGLL